MKFQVLQLKLHKIYVSCTTSQSAQSTIFTKNYTPKDYAHKNYIPCISTNFTSFPTFHKNYTPKYCTKKVQKHPKKKKDLNLPSRTYPVLLMIGLDLILFDLKLLVLCSPWWFELVCFLPHLKYTITKLICNPNSFQTQQKIIQTTRK